MIWLGLLLYLARAVAVDEADVDRNTAVDKSTVHVSNWGGPATKLAGLLSLLTPHAAASFQVQGGLRAGATGRAAVAGRSVMAEQPDAARWRRSTLPAMSVASEGDDIVDSLNRLFDGASATQGSPDEQILDAPVARAGSPPEQIPDAPPPPEPRPKTVFEDPAFAAQLEQLTKGAELAKVRERTHELEVELEYAKRHEDYAEAAALRDELAPLYAADPAKVADKLRRELADLVSAERFAEAARVRDQMIVLRRFQPQYQLAGLWKGHYPNHGDAIVRFTYEGDTLVATKVTGDEHVPAGQITFRADVAAVDTEPVSEGLVEIVRIQPEGTHEKTEAERYRGEGCVAAKGYQRAHYIPGQLHLLEDGEDLDVVGFHWVQLGTFVMFSRATEEEGRLALQAERGNSEQFD